MEATMQAFEDIQIVSLELFDAAFPVAPHDEADVKRRFMTLFVAGRGQRGGSGNVSKATNAQGEAFALKRLKVSDEGNTPSGGTPAGSAPSSRKELRHSISGSNSESVTPDYITQGHVTAFYEEYRIQLAVGQLRGFPRVYGFGLTGNDPVIIMEWVEGETLRKAMRTRTQQDGTPLSLFAVADLGIAVLTVLERAGELDEGFVHRDLSPRNIMLRSDRIDPAEQLRTGDFDLCLIDFGSSAPCVTDDPTFTMSAGIWRMGTPSYAPPEMLSSDIAFPAGYRQSETIDVYALSSVLYELYAGRTPFRLKSHSSDSPYRVKTENAPDPLDVREPDGGALAGIIQIGLSPSQEARPGIAQLKAALQNWKKLPSQQNVEAVGLRSASAKDLWQPGQAEKTIGRRKFIAAGIVAAAAIAAGAIIIGKPPKQPAADNAIDMSKYATTGAAYTGEPLFKVLDGDIAGWAFSTREGQILCRPESSRECGPLREGLAWLFDDASQRYGFITPAGGASGYAWKILPAFAQVGSFSEGLAAAQDADTLLWGYIDQNGQWAIEPQFVAASAFSNGVASVRAHDSAGLWGAVDTAGRWTLQPRFTTLGSQSEDGHAIAEETPGSWGIVDSTGDWTSAGRFPLLRRFANGLAPAIEAESGLWGFVDSAGNWAIAPAFLGARPFYSLKAAVQDERSQLWHFINPDGSVDDGAQPRFWKLGDLHDELAGAQASVKDDTVVFDDKDPDNRATHAGRRYGYVDATGTWQLRRLTTLIGTAIGPVEI